jgi:CheY-like chemotaxis protein
MPNHRVLVVDDHPDSADITAQLLALHGHDARAVHTCAEARAAIAGADRFIPDVVVVDVRLPDGDGFALAAELVAALPVRPALIAHTGTPGLAAKCRAAGFDHYLLKPADPIELAEIVARCARA